MVSTEEFAIRIDRCDSEEEAASLRQEAAALSRDDPRILWKLLVDKRRGVREFAVSNATAFVGKLAASKLVDVYLRDRDPDIRADALQQAIEVDPGAAARVIPRLRRQLQSRDFYEPVDAMWALLTLRDVDSEAAIEALASRRRDWTGKVASVVSRALRGDEESLIAQLLGHDHFVTNWLARAGASLGTEAMHEATRVASDALPDDECRSQCLHWLERFPQAARDTPTDGPSRSGIG